jgi:hypothetical protein
MRLIHGIVMTLVTLATISGAAVWVDLWLEGALGSDFNPLWVVGYALTLLLVVLGAFLDIFANNRTMKVAALVMLSLGTMALLGFGAISFIVAFIAPAVFAFGATALAFGTLGARRSAPRAA